MHSTDRRLAALASAQRGAFTRAQAMDAGVSDRQLRLRVARGTLEQTGPNAFRVAGGARSPVDDLFAVVLDVGRPAWVAGPTAAALHGLGDATIRRPFHLLMPIERNVRRSGVVIHRSSTIDPIDTTWRRGVPVTSAVRTVIDLARSASTPHLDELIEHALLQGLVNEDLLYRRIARIRGRGRFGIPTLLDVLDRRRVRGGTESWLEREYLALLERAGLPRPQTQQVLTRAADRLVRVDCRFRGTDVVVELLGYQFHRSRDQMSGDAARLNALLADGFRPYQFTYDHVVNEPTWVLDQTRLALARSRPAA